MESISDSDLSALALIGAWLLYFVVHSLLASLSVKRAVSSRWPNFMPTYRLAYNACAVIFLIPILWLHVSQAWPPIWQWHGLGKLVANILTGLALVGFVWSLKYYDLQEFLGLKQWRGKVAAIEDQEHLQISFFHRFVRHPWYFFGIVLLWSRDMNSAQFITTAMASIYFAIGSRLEERKLLTYYGQRYRSYMERVPGLFPLPWKYLSVAEAKELASSSK